MKLSDRFAGDSSVYITVCTQCNKIRNGPESSIGNCTCAHSHGIAVVGQWLHLPEAPADWTTIPPEAIDRAFGRDRGVRFVRVAWECPRCHTINAPHVDRCNCGPGE